jgi:hypothetical protein
MTTTGGEVECPMPGLSVETCKCHRSLYFFEEFLFTKSTTAGNGDDMLR